MNYGKLSKIGEERCDRDSIVWCIFHNICNDLLGFLFDDLSLLYHSVLCILVVLTKFKNEIRCIWLFDEERDANYSSTSMT